MLSLLKAGDLIVLVLSWLVALELRLEAGEMGLTPHELPDSGYRVVVLLSIVLTILVFNRFDMYEPKRTKGLATEMADMARAQLVVWLLTYILGDFVGPEERLSRILMTSLLVSWLVLGQLSRLGARLVLRAFRKHRWNARSAAIVGTGRLGQKLLHALQRNRWTGIQPLYWVATMGSRMAGRDELLDLPIAGQTDQLERILADKPVDIVFVALSGKDHDQAERVLSQLATSSADVQVVPDLLSFHFLRHDVTQLEGLPVISLTHSPQDGWNSLLKRGFDVVGSVFGIILTAPLMLLAAGAIKLTSPGPVIYRQRRTSLGGSPFVMLKFRTMVEDAEAKTGPVWAVPDDPRATGVGRWLRRTSLDELPQLFNVLRGDMSLVGPRPERPELINRFRRQVPRYMLRHRVRAGLTGWAQIHGLRGQSSLRKRVQYDLHYISHWTFGLDLRILLLTPFRGLLAPNAY